MDPQRVFKWSKGGDTSNSTKKEDKDFMTRNENATVVLGKKNSSSGSSINWNLLLKFTGALIFAAFLGIIFYNSMSNPNVATATSIHEKDTNLKTDLSAQVPQTQNQPAANQGPYSYTLGNLKFQSSNYRIEENTGQKTTDVWRIKNDAGVLTAVITLNRLEDLSKVDLSITSKKDNTDIASINNIAMINDPENPNGKIIIATHPGILDSYFSWGGSASVRPATSSVHFWDKYPDNKLRISNPKEGPYSLSIGRES